MVKSVIFIIFFYCLSLRFSLLGHTTSVLSFPGKRLFVSEWLESEVDERIVGGGRHGSPGADEEYQQPCINCYCR